jgi:uncharacterized membrane protein YdjX (TVP38/TMEM64 family)
MKRYVIIMGGMLAFFLAVFLVVEAFGIRLLVDPTPWMRHGGTLAAVLGVTLLVADVLLPIPSSLIMVAHGALFGVWGGTALSLVGSVGASLFGFAIGRRGGPLLRRITTPEERARADSFLRQWGALAVCLSRPLPLLAETVAIMAGTSGLGWGRMALASLAGSLPPALLYALTGAAVADFRSAALMFLVVMFVTGLFWLASRLVESYFGKGRARRRQARENTQA